MDTKLIFNFLHDIAANNNRPWFQEHKAEYEKAKAEFEKGVEEAITAISKFDPSISHLTVKDCCYRFYRDTRFSLDKSPYKRHFGAYISAHGKKSLHGGYYMHLKKAPKDFPKDYEFLPYLKMKDYCAWHCVDDDFFINDNWTQAMSRIFKIGKPMMDMVNDVVDDYE